MTPVPCVKQTYIPTPCPTSTQYHQSHHAYLFSHWPGQFITVSFFHVNDSFRPHMFVFADGCKTNWMNGSMQSGWHCLSAWTWSPYRYGRVMHVSMSLKPFSFHCFFFFFFLFFHYVLWVEICVHPRFPHTDTFTSFPIEIVEEKCDGWPITILSHFLNSTIESGDKESTGKETMIFG